MSYPLSFGEGWGEASFYYQCLTPSPLERDGVRPLFIINVLPPLLWRGPDTSGGVRLLFTIKVLHPLLWRGPDTSGGERLLFS